MSKRKKDLSSKIEYILHRQKELSTFPDRMLLLELIRRNGADEGPKKSTYYGMWVETLVAVDDDHTATIRMPLEDFEALHK